MNKKHFYAAVILLLFLGAGIQPALATKYIPGDTTIGEWDDFNRIYKLTTDVFEGLVIEESNLTLDGADNTVSYVSGPQDNGVFVQDKEYITIKNLNVQNFATGIHLSSCQNSNLIGNTTKNNNTIGTIGILLARGTSMKSINNTLIGNTASNNNHGIKLNNSEGDILTDNTAEENTQYGIWLQGSYNYTLTGNTVSYNSLQGIRSEGFSVISTNTLTNNTISYNYSGIGLSNASYNQIYNNNFIDNEAYQANVSGGSDNEFYLPYPTGGNYWSDYSGLDNDANGFGDTPYEFNGGQDNLPIFSAKLAIIQLIDKVEGINAKEGIINSLDVKLQNALDALDAANAGLRQDAINKMQAFINAVEAQSGNQIEEVDASALIDFAEYIIGML